MAVPNVRQRGSFLWFPPDWMIENSENLYPRAQDYTAHRVVNVNGGWEPNTILGRVRVVARIGCSECESSSGSRR
jgi:hypothetical protein